MSLSLLMVAITSSAVFLTNSSGASAAKAATGKKG